MWQFSDPNAKDAVVRFVIPTPLPGSSFTCTTSKPCRMLLYTSYNNSCQQVQSTSLGVTVFDTMERAQTCVTEVAFQFEHDGNHDICFLSASIGYQARCFSVTVMHSAVNDVCSDTTCHNDGACITKSPDKYKCICKEGFTGVKCEQGPCLDRDNTCTHNGTCFVNNHAITCVCEEGTSGDMCESVLTSASEIALTGRSPVFTGTSAIKTISCNKNRECGFSALVVGISAGNMRQIVKGRVSSTLSNIEIRIEALPFRPDFHQAVISFIPTEVGVFDMCILTVNASGTNQDELCLEVDVEEGAMSQYGAKDMPHFVSPSLPLDSKIECEFKTVCHVTFTAHPGLQHEFECIKPSLLRSNFVNTHIFSTCSSCIDGSNTNASCTLDVAFRPSVQNKTDSKVCIVLIRKRTGVSGEDRCFTVTVRNTSKTKDMIGCQLLQCANGGFCDGHDPVNPCVFLQTRIWWTNLCYIYPDQSTHKHPSSEPTVDCRQGFSAACWKRQCALGTVNVTSSELGTHRFCIQHVQSGGLVDDELCPTIRITGGASSPIDQSKPHFLSPTFESGSTLACTKGEDLHLKPFYTNGNSFGSFKDCPTLTESSQQPVDGVYIFPAEFLANICSSDIVYKVPSAAAAGSESKLCIKVSVPGKQGEERCIMLRVAEATHGVPTTSTTAASTTMSKTAQSQASSIHAGGNSIGGTTMLPYVSSCNFDNDTNCIWHNVHAGDNFDWTLHQGETPSENTGPTYDHTTGTLQGKYYYIETSAPRQSNETAWLQSEYRASSYGETHCLEFWYYMFGSSIGYLNVRLSENTTVPGYNIWSMEGNQGPKWIFAQVTVTTDGLNRIIFEGTVGKGYEGDIALDDISFKQGNCSIAQKITSVASTVPTTIMPVFIGQGCYGDPCVRGVCYVHLDEYFCLCPSGFNGINCEIDTDECRPAPCKNGATCEDGVDMFICHCPAGYTGHLCEIYMDPCNSNPCRAILDSFARDSSTIVRAIHVKIMAAAGMSILRTHASVHSDFQDKIVLKNMEQNASRVKAVNWILFATPLLLATQT
ncbi:hypothetical protein DPMN_093071, partial [Dreissena polymorpha]